MMTALEILKEAREEHSNSEMWTKGSRNFTRNEGPVCIYGMIWRVARLNRELQDEAVGVIYTVLCGNPFPAAPLLSNWNDDPSRTHADILAVYDAAIAKLESEAVQ